MNKNETQDETHFHINGFTKTRFDAETKENLEKAYCRLTKYYKFPHFPARN